MAWSEPAASTALKPCDERIPGNEAIRHPSFVALTLPHQMDDPTPAGLADRRVLTACGAVGCPIPSGGLFGGVLSVAIGHDNLGFARLLPAVSRREAVIQQC
jgi:hypothetical protein